MSDQPTDAGDELPDGALLLAEVRIVRYLSLEGRPIDIFRAVDGNGDKLPLTETLGILCLAQNTAIETAGDDEDDL